VTRTPLSLQFGIEEDVRPQQIPTWSRLDPPVEVTFAPRVALFVVMEVAVGEVTVGVVAGVTEFEAAEAEPVPTALVAVTVKVYAVPLVRPVTK